MRLHFSGGECSRALYLVLFLVVPAFLSFHELFVYLANEDPSSVSAFTAHPPSDQLPKLRLSPYRPLKRQFAIFCE